MENQKSIKILVGSVSVLIPVVVALLYIIPKGESVTAEVMLLPKLNAFLNSMTSLCLIAGFISIKNEKVELHRKFMFTAIILSVLFLLSYVTYHLLAESTPYGGEGMMRSIYYFVLLSHILLAIVIVPLVLISFTRALSEKFDKHRKIARITLPLWLYVTLTGVIVYFMISPYY